MDIHIFIMFIFSFTETFILSSSISQIWELYCIVQQTSNVYFEFSTCQNNIVTTEKNYAFIFHLQILGIFNDLPKYSECRNLLRRIRGI